MHVCRTGDTGTPLEILWQRRKTVRSQMLGGLRRAETAGPMLIHQFRLRAKLPAIGLQFHQRMRCSIVGECGLQTLRERQQLVQ